MTFKQKWENYWYHYKLHTIAAVVVFALAFVGLKSCVDKEEIDFHAVYISDSYVFPETEDKMGKALIEEGIIRDIDGDGVCNYYLDALSLSFDVDGNNDQTTLQKLQTILYAGQHTLVFAHEYALEDYDGVFEDISSKAEKGHKTYTSPGERFVSGISVSGNTFLEEMGINTENLYVAMRRRNNKEAKDNDFKEEFDMAYDVMDYILSFNPSDE